MKHHIIDCHKLMVAQDIPTELKLLRVERYKLLKEKEQLRYFLIALSAGLGISIIYQIINHYGKKKKKNQN